MVLSLVIARISFNKELKFQDSKMLPKLGEENDN